MKKAIATQSIENEKYSIKPGDFVYYEKFGGTRDYFISIDEDFSSVVAIVGKDYIDSLADPDYYDSDLIYAVYRINKAYAKIGSAVDFGSYWCEKYEFLIEKFARELQMSPARLEDIATDVRFLGWFED